MLDIVSFLIGLIDNPLIISLVLGALPISEIRGAAIYAFSIGQHWLILPAMLANILVAPIILLFWNILNIPYWGKLILGKRLEERLLSLGKQYDTQGAIAIAIFIGIPLPLTGVYTGTLIAELLGIKRSHTILAAIAGVCIAAALMYFALGSVSFLSSLFLLPRSS
jgi:uncharacterized membrane protein